MNLDNLRKQIDQVDESLLTLFEERMDIVAEITRTKVAEGLPTLDRAREREKLQALEEKIRPELAPYAHILYDTLFELSRRYQRAGCKQSSGLFPAIQTAIEETPNLFPPSASVACQGVEGAYSQQAADRLFQRPNIQYFKSFDSVFSAIENGFCNYGVLPLENSTAGSVTKIYSLM